MALIGRRAHETTERNQRAGVRDGIVGGLLVAALHLPFVRNMALPHSVPAKDAPGAAVRAARMGAARVRRAQSCTGRQLAQHVDSVVGIDRCRQRRLSGLAVCQLPFAQLGGMRTLQAREGRRAHEPAEIILAFVARQDAIDVDSGLGALDSWR